VPDRCTMNDTPLSFHLPHQARPPAPAPAPTRKRPDTHADVYAHMLKLGWDRRPGVTILFGRWQDVLPRLLERKFDGIFFDTYGAPWGERVGRLSLSLAAQATPSQLPVALTHPQAIFNAHLTTSVHCHPPIHPHPSTHPKVSTTKSSMGSTSTCRSCSSRGGSTRSSTGLRATTRSSTWCTAGGCVGGRVEGRWPAGCTLVLMLWVGAL